MLSLSRCRQTSICTYMCDNIDDKKLKLSCLTARLFLRNTGYHTCLPFVARLQQVCRLKLSVGNIEQFKTFRHVRNRSEFSSHPVTSSNRL